MDHPPSSSLRRPYAVSKSFLGDVALRLEMILDILEAQFVPVQQDALPANENSGEPVEAAVTGYVLSQFLRVVGRAMLEQQEDQMRRQRHSIIFSASGSLDVASKLKSEDAENIADRETMTRRKSIRTLKEKQRQPRSSSEPSAQTANAGSPSDNRIMALLEEPLVVVNRVHQAAQERERATGRADVIETFAQQENFLYCLASTFFELVGSSSSSSPSPAVRLASTDGTIEDTPADIVCTFNDLRTFVLRMLLSKKSAARDGDNGHTASSRGVVCPLTVTRGRPCKALYHAHLLREMMVEEKDLFGNMRSRLLLLGAIRTKAEQGAKVRVVDGQTLEVTAERVLPVHMGNILSLAGATCRHTRNSTRLIFIATADGTLQALEVDSGLRRQKLNVSCRSPWISMLELRGNGLLAGGDTTGNLQIWNLRDIAKHVHLPDMSLHSLALVTAASAPMLHRGAITAMTADTEAQLLFTAGLDLFICQYCTRTFTKIRKLQGHRQLIRSLAFSRSENVLVSGGTEHMLYMWPLEMVDCVPQTVSIPTNRGTMQVGSLEGTNIAVTMDARGTFVLWDLRLAHWSGFVPCEPELCLDGDLPGSSAVEWSAFAWDPLSKSFVCNANRKLYYIAYSSAPTTQNSLCAHDEGVIARGTVFHRASQTLISCAGTALQVWDVEQARSQHLLPNVAKSEVSSMLLLEEEGVLVLGRDAGTVQFVLVNSFRRLAEYTSSALVDAIVDVQALPNVAPVCVACASRSGSVEVVVLDTETNQAIGMLLRRSSNFTVSLKANSLSSLGGKLLLLGEPANRVSVWSFRRKRSANDFSFLRDGPPEPLSEADFFSKMAECHDVYTAEAFPATDDTTVVIGIPPGNVFVCGDSGGHIHVWAFGGPKSVAWPLAHFPCRRYNALLPRSVVRSLVYCEELGLLYSGDDNGCVSVFDVACSIPVPSEASVLVLTTMVALHPRNAPCPVLLPPPGTPALTSIAVQPIVSWDAHPESSVEFMCLIPMPLVLVTTSSDGVIQMWYLGGTPIGCLVAPSAIVRAGGYGSGAPETSQCGIYFGIADKDETSTAAKSPRGSTSRVGKGFETKRSDAVDSAAPPQPQPSEKDRTVQLVSFLTDFRFGDDAHEGGTDDDDDDGDVPATKELSSATKEANDEKLLHRYNDLPHPYGFSDVSNRKMTAFMLKGILSTQGSSVSSPEAEVETEGGSGTLLRSLSVVEIDPRRGAPAANKLRSAPQSLLQVEPSLAEKIAAIRRRDEIAKLNDAPSHIEARHNESLDDSNQILHHSTTPPPYMSKDKMSMLHSRPLQCKYTPSNDLTEAMYGSAEAFQSFVKRALCVATQSTTNALAHQQRLVVGKHKKPDRDSQQVNGNRSKYSMCPVDREGFGEVLLTSRHLPSHMFPSSLRRSATSMAITPQLDGYAEASRRSLAGGGGGGGGAPRFYGPSPRNPSPVKRAIASDVISVTSPLRIVRESEKTSDIKTMGEETAYQYHTELYRPVVLPPIRKVPGPGTSMFSKKSEELAELNNLPGLMMHVTQSNSMSPQAKITPYQWSSTTTPDIEPSSRLLAPTQKS